MVRFLKGQIICGLTNNLSFVNFLDLTRGGGGGGFCPIYKEDTIPFGNKMFRPQTISPLVVSPLKLSLVISP